MPLSRYRGPPNSPVPGHAFPANEKAELESSKIKKANGKKLRIEAGYYTFVITGILLVLLAFLLLRDCA